MKSTALAIVAAVLLSFTGTCHNVAADETLNIVVMDPMAAPLACDCVKGYAQRKYEKLGQYLEKSLGCKVHVYWSGSLPAALKEHKIQADLVIGKHSVVLSDAKLAGLNLKPMAQLANPDGSLTQTGLIVVRQHDKAQSVADLTSYRILFGPQDCDEKNRAPMDLLKRHGVQIPSPLETSAACSTAAAALLELPTSVDAAAVISSYAAPLLEGCGTVKKGDLRVIGISEPVPFITAFAGSKMDGQQWKTLQSALLDVELNAELLVALESSSGFVAWKDQTSTDAEARQNDAAKKKS